MTTVVDQRIARLRWRCRRGMKELDQLVLNYLEQAYLAADTTERAAFEALLDLDDAALYALLTGRTQSTDREIANVVKKISALPTSIHT